MVGAGEALLRQYLPRESPEAALHAVADDGAADLLGDRDAEPHGRIAVLALADQQDEAGHRRAPAAIRREEIRAAADCPAVAGSPYADRVFRPRARRAASIFRPPQAERRFGNK